MESLMGGAASIKAMPAKNTTGAVVTVGDVLMLDFDTERDGYSAIVPVLSNLKDYRVPCGPVIGLSGATFADDADLMIGIRGIFLTKIEATQDIAAEDALYLQSGQSYMVTLAAQPDPNGPAALIAAAAFNKTVAAVAKTATAVAKTATAVGATATMGFTPTAATMGFTKAAAFPTATGASNLDASMYVAAEINGLGDTVLNAKAWAADVGADLAALDILSDQIVVDLGALDAFSDAVVVDVSAFDAFTDAAVVDLTALDAFTDQVLVDVPVIETLLDELKTDFDTNAALIDDAMEPNRVKAIALAAATANTTAVVNAFWLG